MRLLVRHNPYAVKVVVTAMWNMDLAVCARNCRLVEGRPAPQQSCRCDGRHYPIELDPLGGIFPRARTLRPASHSARASANPCGPSHQSAGMW